VYCVRCAAFSRVVLQRDGIDPTTQPVKLNTIELSVEVGAEQLMNPDLFIACGGPADLATAIVAAHGGLSIVVSEAAPPPIDRAHYTKRQKSYASDLRQCVQLVTNAFTRTRAD
jgi:hypothetical protein